ncbi:hypothetical protein J3Q64DRAFT_1640176 [Phycomyces blakesleeanus]|uniref:Arrestin C-terminal-like domain-containing protein n=1 Tax=Phycomyces blakesleeanus TaxID=4837 RepID=A0ABR3AZP6_PHYBL
MSDETEGLSIMFDGGNHVIVRPNRVVRVILHTSDRLYATRIRIKFRAEEVAAVRLDETKEKTYKIHKCATTFFEVDWKLWGTETSVIVQSGWDEIEPGHYEFPFALKFPNVNFPPSMDEPNGFRIRFVWTAQLDGPALQSGLKSREYNTPYRPILVSPPDKEWTYKTTLMRDKKQVMCEVQAKIARQAFCPDEPFSMNMHITTLHSDAKITALHYKFRKHHHGKLMVASGTAFQQSTKNIVQGSIPLTSSNQASITENVTFSVPTRLVSPSFVSRHTRVHYDILITVTVDYGGLFKVVHHSEFAIPISIANLPNDQLLRINELMAVKSYNDSRDSPIFFDPELEEPPVYNRTNNSGPLSPYMLGTPHSEEPPNYFSIPNLHQIDAPVERKERTVYTTRPVNGTSDPDNLPEATFIPGVFDDEW